MKAIIDREWGTVGKEFSGLSEMISAEPEVAVPKLKRKRWRLGWPKKFPKFKEALARLRGFFGQLDVPENS
ncbi:hypothetical protein K2X30_10635 [bacterium]|jgi:hypothetical protein|nr:hypothetical protein [bacterium]